MGGWLLIPIEWSGTDGVHRQVRALMAEADENEDGVIDWREFLPTILPLLRESRQVDALLISPPCVQFLCSALLQHFHSSKLAAPPALMLCGGTY